MTSELFLTNSSPLFEKRTVAELSESEMLLIDGGSTIPCGAVVGAAIGVAVVGTVFVTAVAVGFIYTMLKD
jgi:hypothetical protein